MAKDLSTPYGVLVLTAVVTSAISLGFTLYGIKLYESACNLRDQSTTKSSTKNSRSKTTVKSSPAQEPKGEDLLTSERRKALADSYVVVVGAGGVGSWAASMLVRSGVGKLRIIDFDQVTLSSLNRHAVAQVNDVGLSKVQAIFNHLSKVTPSCVIEPIVSLWDWTETNGLTDNGAWEILCGEKTAVSDDNIPKNDENNQKIWDRPDYVLDCIDNVDTKVRLMEFCYRNEIKLISSMGAACKGDASSVRICDISESLEDSLSRTCRRKLKPKGISSGIQVVFSTEKPSAADSNSGTGSGKASLMPLDEEEFLKGNVDELGILNRFRVRILPVLGTMPGLFGLNMANHVILEIANSKLVPEYVLGRFGLKFYDTPLQGLLGQLQRLGYGEVRVPWNLEDVMFLVEEVFRGKSIVSGSTNRINLSMWVKGAGYGRDNIVVMTKEEQRKHEDLVFKKGMSLIDVYGQDICDLANSRLSDVKSYEKYR